MVSFAVLASGNGTNFQALVDGIKNDEIKNVEIKVLITDKSDAMVIQRAKNANVPFYIVKKENFTTREEMDLEIKRIVDSYKVDYIYLLGYMLLIKAKKLLEEYSNKIINLHPSLLPAFPGIDAQKQAFEYGCKVSGITIHLVTEGLDTGPILYQTVTDISECKNAEEVHEKLRILEHCGVKKIAQMLANGKFVVSGKTTKYMLYSNSDSKL